MACMRSTRLFNLNLICCIRKNGIKILRHNPLQSDILQKVESSPTAIPNCFLFNANFQDEQYKLQIVSDMRVFDDFVSEQEEESLMKEVDPYMKRLKYEINHWDDAIEGYRETEKSRWSSDNSIIIDRIKKLAFGQGTQPMKFVHVLDLQDKGVIKPHIDSSRFCGNTIAGISLLTDAVMRLQHDKEKDKIIDVYLKRRSLYLMTGIARYDYTHEILGNEDSKFGDKLVVKSRRISIICRNEP